MEIEVSELENGVTILKPFIPRLDLEVATQFRTTLLEQIQSGRRNIVVDLQNVSFIDSSGLGSLVSGLKLIKTTTDRRHQARGAPTRRRATRGDIRLANVQDSVASLLEIIRLHRVFASYPSVEAAANSYPRNPT